MCGILGVINGEKFASNSRATNGYMADGCLWGVVRGRDSTGIFQVNDKWDASVMKYPVDGYVFSEHKKVQEKLRNVDSNLCTVIHHRAATHGSVTYNNCHPFEHESPDGNIIIGVHNGTIHSFSRREDGIDFNVDSDWLYYRIARDGAEKALGSFSDGAYSLVWADKNKKLIRIASNQERPLHFSYVKNKNIMLIASEHEMLYALASRNGMELECMLTPEKEKVYNFSPDDVRKYSKNAIEKIVVKKSSYYPAADGWPRQQKQGETGTYVPQEKSINGRKFRDHYSEDSASKRGLKNNMEVEFFPTRGSVFTRPDYPSGCEIWGEILAEDNSTIYACIPHATMTMVDNLETASTIICKIMGVREMSDNKTAQPHYMALLTGPTKLIKNGDNEGNDAVEGLLTLEEGDFRWISAQNEEIQGPRGLMPRVDFLRLTKDGCAACCGNITEKDAPNLTWTLGNEPICKECAINERRHGGALTNA